jgi:hypothetical protein
METPGEFLHLIIIFYLCANPRSRDEAAKQIAMIRFCF